jgi:hypothetical protein
MNPPLQVSQSYLLWLCFLLIQTIQCRLAAASDDGTAGEKSCMGQYMPSMYLVMCILGQIPTSTDTEMIFFHLEFPNDFDMIFPHKTKTWCQNSKY